MDDDHRLAATLRRFPAKNDAPQLLLFRQSGILGGLVYALRRARGERSKIQTAERIAETSQAGLGGVYFDAFCFVGTHGRNGSAKPAAKMHSQNLRNLLPEAAFYK